MLLDNKNKWLDIVNNQKYVDMRNKILDSFNELIFVEDGHKYYLHGKELISVTTLCHKYQDFDRDKVAQGTFKRNYNNPKSKYYKMSLEQILEKWDEISDEASTHGSKIHLFGESCFYYMCGMYDQIPEEYRNRLTEDGFFESKEPKEDAIIKFFMEIPKKIVPILAEAMIFLEGYDYLYEKEGNYCGFAGTFDMLFYYDNDDIDTTKSGFYVMDWKTNVDLYKNFNKKKLLYPFDDKLDKPINTYEIQLSFYTWAIETIGLKVVARRVIWLRDNGEYEKIGVKNVINRIKNST